MEFITLIYHKEVMYQLKKFKVLFVKAISVTFTPLYGLYGGVPLDRVWFLTSLSQTGNIISRESVLKRVYNFESACPNYKQDDICLYPM